MKRFTRIMCMLLAVIMIAGLLPLTAIAEDIQSTHTVKFSLNYNGAKTIPSQKIEDGECASEPENETRTGYILKGWYEKKNGGEKFDFTQPIHESKTLYAQWNEDPSYWAGIWNKGIVDAIERGKMDDTFKDDPSKDDIQKDLTYEELIQKQEEELENIEKLNGGELPEMYLDEEDNIPATIIGSFSEQIVTDYKSAIEALKDIQYLMLFEDVENEFVGADINTYKNTTQYRLQQMYKGVEVYGKQLIITTDSNGLIMSLTGDYDPLSDVMDETISLTMEQALSYALDEYDNVDANGELVVYTVKEGYNEYAYHFSGSGEVIVSAIDGIVLMSFSNTQTARLTDYTATKGRGYDLFGGITYTIDTVYDNTTNQYVFYDSTRNIYYMDAENQDTDWTTYYYMDFLTDDDDVWDYTISKSIVLYQNLSSVYDFYVDNLGIYSYDNANGEIRAYVNDGYKSGNNACNSGPVSFRENDNENYRMVTHLRFGTNSNYQNELDIVGHEFTHAVQGSLVNNLAYSGETGTLMEGYSDFMGELVELVTNGQTNWFHGEKDTNPVSGNRNIADPLSEWDWGIYGGSVFGLYLQYPQKYKGTGWAEVVGDTTDGYCVHHNSTVISHALYNMYQYGLNDVSELSELLYRAWRHLSSTAVFSSYYTALLTACVEMNLDNTKRGYIARAFNEAEIGCDEYKSSSLFGKWITFNIQNTNEEAIPGASVFLLNSTVLQTNENGICKVKIFPGDYQVIISAPGYKAMHAILKVTDDATETYRLISIPTDPSYVDSFSMSGWVRDSQTDNFIADAEVQLRKGNGITTGRTIAVTRTDSNGAFSFTNLEHGYYTAYVYKEGYIGSYETIIVRDTNLSGEANVYIFVLSKTLDNDDQLRFVLTWGQNPRDLDSHITGKLSNGNDFHVYYSNKQAIDADGTVVANLDIDDTTSYGPETTTLNWSDNIEYSFYIHLFAGSGTLSSSDANIKIYSGSKLIYDIKVPSDSDSMRWWKICTFKNGEMTIINTFSNDMN